MESRLQVFSCVSPTSASLFSPSCHSSLPVFDVAMTAEVAAASTSSKSSASSQRLAHPTAILPNAQALRDAKVLVVGAGGIGCEVLKNLALVGVKGVQVVSPDRGQDFVLHSGS